MSAFSFRGSVGDEVGSRRGCGTRGTGDGFGRGESGSPDMTLFGGPSFVSPVRRTPEAVIIGPVASQNARLTYRYNKCYNICCWNRILVKDCL